MTILPPADMSPEAQLVRRERDRAQEDHGVLLYSVRRTPCLPGAIRGALEAALMRHAPVVDGHRVVCGGEPDTWERPGYPCEETQLLARHLAGQGDGACVRCGEPGREVDDPSNEITGDAATVVLCDPCETQAIADL